MDGLSRVDDRRQEAVMSDAMQGGENRPFRGGRGTQRGTRLSAVLSKPRFIACDDIVATRVTDVAKACRPGDVFVARLTDAGDGHEQVHVAARRGAVGIVAERMVATDGLPLCLVADSSAAFGQLAQALAGAPSRAMRVIAVAGTSGKTTTAWLAAAVLAEAGARVGVLSDLGCLGPDDALPEPVDFSSATGLAATLAGFVAGGCSHAIVEVSSRMLAAWATAGLQSDTVVVTNLAAAHLDRHSTRRGYRDIVARTMESLVAGGCLVTGTGPRDRDWLLARAPADATCLRAGLTDGCDVRATSVERTIFGRTFLLGCGGTLVPVAADTPVVPFVRDAALAAAVGARYGVSVERAANAIAAAGSVPGRVERIDRGQNVPVFVDSPTTMHALSATLASLRRLTPGRMAVVADARAARRIGSGRFAPRLTRWCDDCVVVPPTVCSDEPTAADLAGYARIDRLLGSLGRRDCLLVLGDVGRSGGGPGAGPFPLAAVVESWLQMAHPAVEPFAGRRAA
jgi:UDP-N-acetylmuramoyl-L-alanyl-D-glutamate--2,6-diaminopimelate ligase